MTTRLSLTTRNLKSAFSFYSALGIEWIGGEDRADNIPEIEEAEMGLPNLWGRLGNLELMFYSSPSIAAASGAAAVLLISYSENRLIDEVLNRLAKEGLLYNKIQQDNNLSRSIFDPDGRLVELLGPGVLGS